MSTTGKMQAISSRGFRLQWRTDLSDIPDYSLLTCEVLDDRGAVVAGESRAIKTSGSLVTKESAQAQRDVLIAWAEEVTRNPITPPVMVDPEPGVAVDTSTAEENVSHGEEISGPVPSLNDVEAQADDPV